MSCCIPAAAYSPPPRLASDMMKRRLARTKDPMTPTDTFRKPRWPRRPLPGLRLVVASLLCLGAGCVHTPRAEPRPSGWAHPVEAPALPNLHRVSEHLYRSARPREGGLETARALGIRTVVNLRPGDDGKQHPGGAGLESVRIPVNTGSPSYDAARRFFAVVDDPEKAPVLLHCYHGADRTGAFTALYRINRQGWSEDEAIREMTGGGYRFHRMWKSLIEWVREAPEF